MKTRYKIIVIGLIFTLLSTVYIIRLASLQWFPSSGSKTVQGKLSTARNWRLDAVQQRQGSLLLHDSRALFFDDKGNLLHRELHHHVLIIPHLVNDKELTIRTLAPLVNLMESDIEEQLASSQPPFWLLDDRDEPVLLVDEQISRMEQEPLQGVYVMETTESVKDKPINHSIGFAAQHPELLSQLYEDKLDYLDNWTIRTEVGALGLERSFDRYLHGVRNDELVWYEDGLGEVIAGLGVNRIGDYNHYPLHVQTTIDSELQSNIDRLLELHEHGKMAVVVLDINTNDIKAIASKPQLFPRKLEHAMLKNNALTSHKAGSIYKVITLAAALEFNKVKQDEQFICDGEYGKYGLSCWRHGGHGKQSLKQAFANSCNVVFAQLSERLSAKQIADVAEILGVIEATSWHSDAHASSFFMLGEEENGRVFFDKLSEDAAERAQAAIGQRDVIINPLQAASMMATIARGGDVLEARLATHISFANGQPFLEFEQHRNTVSRYKLKANTIAQLEQYLEEVVENGTGALLKQAPVTIAGKTGTAQLTNDETENNHYWFIGYFPVEQPKYAMAVVMLDAKQTNNPATKLFLSIVEKIYKGGEVSH